MDMSFAFQKSTRTRQGRTILNYAALLARAAATQALSPTARAAMLLGRPKAAQEAGFGSFHAPTAMLIVNREQGW